MALRDHSRVILLLVAYLALGPNPASALPPIKEWVRGLNSAAFDTEARGADTDGNGFLYIAGDTRGSLNGPNSGGNSGASGDYFLQKYDQSGNSLFVTQVGSGSNDTGNAVAVSSTGPVYLAGGTNGDLGDQSFQNLGSRDIWVSRFSSLGGRDWTEQLGSSGFDEAYDAVTDSDGNVYTVGITSGSLDGESYSGAGDAFVIKHSPFGSLRWAALLGTSSTDQANAVAYDPSGAIYVAGHTRGSLQGPNSGSLDAFIAKYDIDGALQWSRQFGTSSPDEIEGIATGPDGAVYVTGRTRGDLDGINRGQDDAFVGKYSSMGSLQWLTQFGTSQNDLSRDIGVDAGGASYVVGSTSGSLQGANSGSSDLILSKLDTDGEILWTVQEGGFSVDDGFAVAIDGDDNVDVYAVGYTGASVFADRLNGFSDGGTDAFVAKFLSPDESITLLGDYNQDGTVDAADYTVWRDARFAAAGTLPNDPTGSRIGIEQYDLWRDNYGLAIDAQTSIPEPTAPMLLALAALQHASIRRP